MDITNSSNISAITAQRLSKLNLNTATRAFEHAKKELENKPNETLDENLEEPKVTLDETKKNKVDVEEIQKYANYMGENLSIDDINYGLMYGRSVIADFSA